MKPINFEKFDAALMETIDGNGQIILDSVVYGAESLANDFTVTVTRDKAALVQLDVKDAWKPASDSFSGEQAISVRSRFATFKEADIDMEVTLSQINEIYKSYIGWTIAPGRTMIELQDNPYEIFFLKHILSTHFEMLRLETAWNGVYNPAGKGAGVLVDGFLTMFTAGRGVNGDIEASHVYDGAAITASNAYDQFNNVAELIKDERPKLLLKPLDLKCSLHAYDLYRKNRRILFKEHVGPADRPTVLDDFSNISFKVDPGLAGKDTIVITPPKNLLFVCNADPGQYRLSIVKAIKSYQISIRVSIGFDYATPDELFLNDNI